MVLLAKDVNFILNDSIYNNKHKCTCMIAFQQIKKVVEIPNGEIPNDNPLPNTKRQMNKQIF